MLLQVDEVKLSKTGKSYAVKSGGRYYTCKALGIEQANGKQIEAQIGSYSFNGQTYPTIESFTIASGGKAPTGQPPNGDRWWLPFVSNQVAHAIAAGLIKEPADMGQWARMAKLTIIALDALLETAPAKDKDPVDGDVPF
jgi:hypothetical protein